MSYNTIIDEEHLSKFKSKSEANIHRIANITKLKLGLIVHYLDYRDWMLSQREKNSQIQRETGMIPIVNFKYVYHQTFNSWLEHTRLENGSVITDNAAKIISYHPDLGYIDEDVSDALAIPQIGAVPVPKELEKYFSKSIEN